MPKWSTIVLLSGGIDSALCALLAGRDEKDFLALTVDYGQNQAEQAAAVQLAQIYHWPHCRVAVTPFPQSLDPAGTNLIPGRNVMFLSIATAMFDPRIAGRIYLGANADDQHDYPDCRPEFFDAWSNICRLQGLNLTVKRPLVNLTKLEVVREARRRGLNLELTVSCYAGTPPCGHCNACRLRHAALTAGP